LKRYSKITIPEATIPTNIKINFSFRTLRRIIVSGSESPITLIINVSTVPSDAPFSNNAYTIGIIPAAFEYIGTPSKTAIGKDHHALLPIKPAIEFSGTYP
jgi:hypothetical protein